MPDIPKIARQRLQAMAQPAPHPDPDLLNAFLEKTITERERQPILEHLAGCADCRQVVSLSAPPAAVAQPAAASARSAWFSWPVLRWAAAAACVVVVGAAVTLHFHDRRPMATFGQEANIPAVSAERETETAAQPYQSQTATDKLSTNKELKQLTPLRRTAPALAKQVGIGQLSDSVAMPSSPPPSNVPASPPAQIAVSAPTSAESRANLGNRETVVVADEATGPVNAAEPAPGKAKEAVQIPAANAKVRLEAGALATLAGAGQAQKDARSKTGAALVPRWTLSTDGTLQRSLDGGRSWENVPVDRTTKFRALSAAGSEIWVGGPAGVLYHSLDAGAHWVQVKPVAGDSMLTADIIGVEFTDGRHGKLTTTSGETWLTNDSGESWTKQ